MGTPIDCVKLADEIIGRIKDDLKDLPDDAKIPTLAIITVGNDPASRIYVNNKAKVASELGIGVVHRHFPENTEVDDVVNYIDQLNIDDDIHGIMVQLPLPVDFEGLEQCITPEKDVDGLTEGSPWMPCTVKAILNVLDNLETPEGEHYSLVGKHIVVANRSKLIGRPLVNHLLDRDMTVTVVHSRTPYPDSYMRDADIIISATGKPCQWLDSMLNPSRPPILIDVGCFKWAISSYVGDFNKGAQEMSYMYTPVPNGIGKVTVACLMDNLMMCYNSMR